MEIMERVCCMCVDVGFPDKLFCCGHCRSRFQHSEIAEPAEICDWCRSDNRKIRSIVRHGGSSSKKSSSSEKYENEFTTRSDCSSGPQIKHSNNHHDQVAKSVVVARGGVPSPKTATRRYKLLKDVMCLFKTGVDNFMGYY